MILNVCCRGLNCGCFLGRLRFCKCAFNSKFTKIGYNTSRAGYNHIKQPTPTKILDMEVNHEHIHQETWILGHHWPSSCSIQVSNYILGSCSSRVSEWFHLTETHTNTQHGIKCTQCQTIYIYIWNPYWPSFEASVSIMPIPHLLGVLRCLQ